MRDFGMKIFLHFSCLLIFSLTPIWAFSADKGFSFAVPPYANPVSIQQQYKPLVDYLAKTINVPISLTISPNYISHVMNLGSGKVDIAFVGPSPYVRAKDKFGNIELLAKFQMKESINDRVVIVAHSDGNIKTCLYSSQQYDIKRLIRNGYDDENILKFIGLSRDDVYTSNIVLCRPPENRDPDAYEVKKCKGYLQRQIELVEPRLIVTFGRFAAQAFLNNFKITKNHGKMFESQEFNINVFPIYHPAYYKAYASLSRRQEFKEDIKKLRNIIEKDFGKGGVNEDTNHSDTNVDSF